VQETAGGGARISVDRFERMAALAVAEPLPRRVGASTS